MCHLTYLAPGLARDDKMDQAQVRSWKQYDVNGLNEASRKTLCLARGRSVELILWLGVTYATGIPDKPVQALFLIILVDMCKNDMRIQVAG